MTDVMKLKGTLEVDRVVVRRQDGGYAELDGAGLVVTDRHGRGRVLVGGSEGEGWRVALLDYGLSRDPGADCRVRAELWLDSNGDVTFAVRHGDGEPVVEHIGEDSEGLAEEVRLARAMLEAARQAADNPPRGPRLRLVRPGDRAE